jgi:DNA-binding CsgD family transcriptional regulator
LLEHAAARADGMELLTTAGVEAEADLAFAGLYGLLRPILGRLSELPELQAKALAGALGLAPSTGSERFLASAAVLGLLAEAAEERPVLCLVEDAHWLDTPSADALVFAARRLRAEPVAIIFAVREGEGRTFEGVGLPELLAAGSDAEPHFLRSIGLAEALSPFERARNELLYGEWLWQERRRVDARPHLRTALELFQRLALSPWEERARAELRASGETARRRDPSTRDQLTPQELQIAHLVTEGMTNREIGEQLFLSPRTIDYHLRKVFAKLQIASRADLVRIDLGEHTSA